MCVCVSARYISLYRPIRCTDFAIEFIASSRALLIELNAHASFSFRSYRTNTQSQPDDVNRKAHKMCRRWWRYCRKDLHANLLHNRQFSRWICAYSVSIVLPRISFPQFANAFVFYTVLIIILHPCKWTQYKYHWVYGIQPVRRTTIACGHSPIHRQMFSWYATALRAPRHSRMSHRNGIRR